MTARKRRSLVSGNLTNIVVGMDIFEDNDAILGKIIMNTLKRLGFIVSSEIRS